MDPSQLLSLNIANQALFNTIKYQVVTGPPGPAGYTGISGSSTNTGATGRSGSSSNTGATGVTGVTGVSGITGSTGMTGANGDATNTGATGRLGATGYTGVTGPNGVASNTGATGPSGPPGPSGSSAGGTFGLIKVKKAAKDFEFSTAVSTLPSSFGTYVPGSSDGISFDINLNASNYSTTNLPFYTVTAYVYSTTAGYINCQRQFGIQSNMGGAFITLDSEIKTITFNYIIRTSNFPAKDNDVAGYALYIFFNIFN